MMAAMIKSRLVVKPMRDDFAAFILSHRRPDRVETIKSLRKRGYTGEIFIVADDEDPTLDAYREMFGDSLLVFSKDEYDGTFDKGDNFDGRGSPVWARNAVFDLARSVGKRFFVMLDDDYYWFGIRGKHQYLMKNLDDVFEAFVEFLSASPQIATVAMSQGGDHIGGFDGRVRLKRKAMNSFFCDTEKPFTFLSRLNDDVNTYLVNGHRGLLFFTVMNVQLDQEDTQAQTGGLTEAYLQYGTYVKSMYSVMFLPSAARIAGIGTNHRRIHHIINWKAAVPKLIHERHRKPGRITNGQA